MKNILTYSEMQSFLDCRKKWDFRYRQGLTPIKINVKLRVGSAIHYGFDKSMQGKSDDEIKFSFDKLLSEGFTDNDWTPEAKDDAAFWWRLFQAARDEFNSRVNYTVVATEQQFYIPIPNRRMIYAGKLDALINWLTDYGNVKTLMLIEHKTKAAITNANLFELQVDEQISGYLWALMKQQSVIPAGVIYNIIRKPSSRIVDKNNWLDKRIAERDSGKGEGLTIQEFVYRSQDEIKKWEDTLVNFVPNIRHPAICRRVSLECSWKCPYRSLCIEDTEEARQSFTKTRLHLELSPIKPSGITPVAEEDEKEEIN